MYAIFAGLLCAVATVALSGVSTQAAEFPTPQTAGVHGGLIVHVGGMHPNKTANLYESEAFLVHGLDQDPIAVMLTRDDLMNRGIYGPVTVEHWASPLLPYSDGVVNMLIVEEPETIDESEILRVLTPGGVAFVLDETNGASSWARIDKPRPDEIDQWTHYLYDASGNAVAHDELIAPPNHLRWEADPKRTRDHDAQASMSAMTSSNGRLFYIIDEGPTSLVHEPATWKLVARDAFNGKLLWKRDVGDWITHLHYFRTGPVQLPRLLVSIEDRVYVTLGFGSPVEVLDATTGETLEVFTDTENVEEFVIEDGVLLAVIGEPSSWDGNAPEVADYWTFRGVPKETSRRVVAVDIDSGETLWNSESLSGADDSKVIPSTLAIQDDLACWMDGQKLIGADLRSGEIRWATPFPTRDLIFYSNYSPTLLLHKNIVACLTADRLAVVNKDNGELLWEKQGYLGFASPGDLFAIDDLLWTFPVTKAVHLPLQDTLGGGNLFQAFDIHTGELRQSLKQNDVWPGGHHHRCYRNKATDRYLIGGRRGLDFVDLEEDNHVINWWTRGVCQYGILPCNGLIYTPPSPCQCFVDIKFDGFHALAAQSPIAPALDAERLLRGPAYLMTRPLHRDPSGATNDMSEQTTGPIWSTPSLEGRSDAWPTYRGDPSRSGSATTTIPASEDLTSKWTATLGDDADLTAPVVADGKLLVADKKRCMLYCLDAMSGDILWEFFANGSIDSPPTIRGSLALFGTRSGYVYAVQMERGALAWRFLAAPTDRRTIGQELLESVWPIHGSVLVVDNTAYFAAGRTTFLDGGIRLYGLDVATGGVECQTVLESERHNNQSDGGMPDILVADANGIRMRNFTFDFDLNLVQNSDIKTLRNTTGLLEDLWAHREKWEWSLGTSSIAPRGKLIVFDNEEAFGVESWYTFIKRDQSMWPPSHTGHLHQKYSRYQEEDFPTGVRLFGQENRNREAGERPSAPGRLAANNHEWNLPLEYQIRAMMLTEDRIFAAGWRDSYQLDQDAPAEKDFFLLEISRENGEILSETTLAAPPVFDGMAAAEGRAYIALTNGTVLCFGEKESR
jgi:outer membrane protein assembly factor BamB